MFFIYACFACFYSVIVCSVDDMVVSYGHGYDEKKFSLSLSYIVPLLKYNPFITTSDVILGFPLVLLICLEFIFLFCK